jgi:hypothetical protein
MGALLPTKIALRSVSARSAHIDIAIFLSPMFTGRKRPQSLIERWMFFVNEQLNFAY